jgi:hypothetical protein
MLSSFKKDDKDRPSARRYCLELGDLAELLKIKMWPRLRWNLVIEGLR